MASEAPRPGIDAGSVLGRAFAVLKASFLPFSIAALLLAGLPSFLDSWLFHSLDDAGDSGPLGLGWPQLFTMIGSLLGGALLQCVLARATIRSLGGHRPDLAGSALLALRLLPPLFALTFYVLFLILIGLVCLIVPGIMIWCALMVVIPVLVEERRGVMGSIDRSRALTRGSRRQILVLGIFSWVALLAATAVTSLIAGTPIWGNATPSDPLLAGAAEGVSAALSALIDAVVVATLYVDLRALRDGPGADVLAGVFD